MKTDYKTIQVELKDEVAVLTMNKPPVNQMSPDFSMELRDAIFSAFEDNAVAAVVLTGTGKNFIAGADITVIYAAKDRELIYPAVLESARFLNRLEMGPKPVIAAINGNCLGGGLETAMACHYRIAVKGASLGQPEVQIPFDGQLPAGGRFHPRGDDGFVGVTRDNIDHEHRHAHQTDYYRCSNTEYLQYPGHIFPPSTGACL